MQSFIDDVTTKTAQLPQRCCFAVCTSTPHSDPSACQYSSFGSSGFSGPYIAVSIAFLRFFRLRAMSWVAGGQETAAVTASASSSSSSSKKIRSSSWSSSSRLDKSSRNSLDLLSSSFSKDTASSRFLYSGPSTNVPVVLYAAISNQSKAEDISSSFAKRFFISKIRPSSRPETSPSSGKT